ncbi:hypothetical protein [Thermomonas sp. HDW16]|uniref:hypothetical protein n=1 Tax=Thermomonas sp. HDW16 TaxID=2714945 RepID=UPI00140A0A01|nr:hypothetical protein [Thermomonas sp. HDW16]QIL19747.1 hypothetical protein G7079_02835 [Thermomonas sp. HDW16]
MASDDSLGRKCAQALKGVLGLHHVEHQSRRFRGTTSLYFFTTPPAEAEVRGENRPVLPLPDGNRWLHIAIDLHFIADKYWRVNHISIGLLQGDPSTPQKEHVLRAEWQIHEAETDSGHAQPHWHVLSAAGVAELPMFDEVVEAIPGFEEFLADARPKPAGNGTFGHFHYAMVTDWHRIPSTGPYQVLADEAAVVAWLEGCVRYIRHQLDHVDRKAGK